MRSIGATKTRLTREEKESIRVELIRYKIDEMMVHEDSKGNMNFHIRYVPGPNGGFGYIYIHTYIYTYVYTETRICIWILYICMNNDTCASCVYILLYVAL